MNITATLACFTPKNVCMFLTPNIESSLDKGDGREIITLDFLSAEYPLFQRLFLSISCIILRTLSSLFVFCLHWFLFVGFLRYNANFVIPLQLSDSFDFLPTWRPSPNSLLLRIMINISIKG